MSLLMLALGAVLGVILSVLTAGGLILKVARPAQGVYSVHYSRYDSDGNLIQGTQEVEAMNRDHAESLALREVFGAEIDNVEYVGPP